MTEATSTAVRFIEVAPAEIGEQPDDRTKWWVDTARPLANPRVAEHPYMLVQTYADKNPNDFRRIEGAMWILFTDQAEYYFVCRDCYDAYRLMQWAGGTKGGPGWRERAYRKCDEHTQSKGWCEFCDPVFGNGGWRR